MKVAIIIFAIFVMISVAFAAPNPSFRFTRSADPHFGIDFGFGFSGHHHYHVGFGGYGGYRGYGGYGGYDYY